MPDQAKQQQGRVIAWDGVSFRMPANWELALYKFLKRGVRRIEIEDEYSVRLEAEWVRPKRKLEVQTVLERYERAAQKLTKKADEKADIEELPAGWTATRYVFRKTEPKKKEGGLDVVTEGLVTAFFLPADAAFFCFMLFHFYPENTENPIDIARLVVSDFRHRSGSALVKWQLFDIAFEVPREFELENTLFDVGAKLMVFRWKLRRFHLWHFSCADMFLTEGVVMEEWVTGYLNGFSRLRGPIFYPGPNGEIKWRRKRRHPFGHRDEITRWCFRYKVRCHHDRAKNQLIAWVFSYRKEEDLKMIPENLRFGKDIV